MVHRPERPLRTVRCATSINQILERKSLNVRTRLIEYGEGDLLFSGLLAWDDDFAGPRPGVLVAHTIRGRSPFEEGKAKVLAELGYAALAIDVYGASQIGGSADQMKANMDALRANREELQDRLTLSLAAMQQQPEVDKEKCAAIGFCFGGLSVIDLARRNAPLSGVVSFHGLFDAPGNIDARQSDCKVLALHGWDDPLATPEAVAAFAEEMTFRDIDWQLHAYGHTQHAFTNPAANDIGRGTVYHAAADRRSWVAAKNFLSELFD